MIAGVVSEGLTDFPIIEELVLALCPNVEQVLPLQPEVDELGQAVANRGGWRSVKAWCETYGSWLDAYLSTHYGVPIELLVIHVDADIAGALGINLPCPPAEEICRQVVEVVSQWLTRPPPAKVIIAVPAMKTEAWICAALLPSNPDIECDRSVEARLTRRGVISQEETGRAAKDVSVYRGLAPEVARKFTKARRICAEAERFARGVQAVCQARVEVSQ